MGINVQVSEQPVTPRPLKDYEALEVTDYLTRSPANAKRLLDAIQALENGQGAVRRIALEKDESQ